MHELAVTESILEIAIRHAPARDQVKITDLYLVIGQLSTIVDDSIQFYWDIISEGTIAQGARLHFRRIPAELSCQNCGHHYAPSDEVLACPNCSSVQIKVVAGEEFYMEAIEVD
ncbi:MAG: hydrogenase maturation nickel metallochaperone HypA [Anaerolineales bacterium]|jgi:hydrogenase nickel incorporation protein HypA/HybF